MPTTSCKEFKEKIENHVPKGRIDFELEIDRALSILNVKAWLSRTRIDKKDGYYAAHLLLRNVKCCLEA